METKTEFGANAIAAISISFLGFGASFLASIIIARLLGVEGKGQFSLFLVSVTTIIAFSGLGVGHGQMYHVSKKPENIIHFMPNGLIVSLIFSGSVALIYFIIGWAWQFKIVALLGWRMVVLAILVTPVLALLVFQRQFFLAVHAYKKSKTISALSQTIPLILYLVLYVLNRSSLENMIIALVAGQFMCLAFFQRSIWKLVPKGGGFSARFAKESISFGIRQYLSDLVNYLTSRLDFFLVVWFLGQSGLGLYSVAVSLAEIGLRLPSELGTILFPAFASGQILGERALSILRKTFLVGILGACIFAVLGRPIILILFGNQFEGSIKAFYWLLPGVVAWSIIYVTWNNLSAAGRPGVGIMVFGAAATFDVLLNIILLPRYGIQGASIAATFSYWLAAFLFLKMFCKKEGCSLREAMLIRPKDIGAIIASMRELSSFILKRSP